MRMGVLAAVVALMATALPLQADQNSRAAQRHGTVAPVDGSAVEAAIQIVFSTGEVELIREHYAPRFRSLPPGLQKKLARTGQLPPGWQRKMEPFPVVLERRLPELPYGYARGVFEGHAVIYIPGTSVVIDATVLF